MNSIPATEIDLYEDAQIRDPYAAYATFRDTGPVVHMRSHNLYVISRLADIRKAALDHRVFSSAKGIAANDMVNGAASNSDIRTTIASDPPYHTRLRQIVGAPLQPAAVRELEPRIQAAADALVDRLVEQGSFDGATDFARHLPLLIVSRLVGLPEEGRQNMLEWAAATFNVLGPMNQRAQTALPKFMEMLGYINSKAQASMVANGSWAARIYDKVDEGVISMPQAATLLVDYLGPSLDTTIFATGHLLHLLGTHPEQWDRLRDDPGLVRNAVEECVRLESPIRGFTRSVTEETEVGGITVPTGARVLLLYASGNRDERRWDQPDKFDVTRDTGGHLGFGAGRHACAGMHLARLEIVSLMTAFVQRVRRFEVGQSTPAMNNVLRGIGSLPVTIAARA